MTGHFDRSRRAEHWHMNQDIGTVGEIAKDKNEVTSRAYKSSAEKQPLS